MHPFLRHTNVIDYHHSAVRSLANELAADTPIATASRCFHWVRDNIRHSIDHGDSHVTLTASEALQHGTGLCYAKSHLLAALLRANSIPCGFVYQRLTLDESGTTFCLHGLNAMWLPEHNWYRVDARGNREGVSAAFDPPQEQLAFATNLPGERLLSEIYADPLPVIVSALSRFSTMAEACKNLPDWDVERNEG